MPASVEELSAVEPVYEYLPGWAENTEGIADFDKLPAAARDYLLFLERHTGVEAGCISTGPERTQTIIREGSVLARLV
jgi:adenylosuccinate synthase